MILWDSPIRDAEESFSLRKKVDDVSAVTQEVEVLVESRLRSPRASADQFAQLVLGAADSEAPTQVDSDERHAEKNIDFISVATRH